MKNAPKSLLSIGEASQRTGLPVSTLASAAKRGALKASRVQAGKTRQVWVFSPHDLSAWLKDPNRRTRKGSRPAAARLASEPRLPFVAPVKSARPKPRKPRPIDLLGPEGMTVDMDAMPRPSLPAPAPGPVIQPLRLMRSESGHREQVDLAERAARNLGLLKHQTGASTAEVLDAALVALVRELALHGVE